MFYKTGFSIKKAIALSFLFLANAIILSHAIFAHHHHDIPVTVVATYYGHDCNHHNDDANPFKCKDPYCHENIEYCVLSMIYASFDYDKQRFQSYNFNFDLLPCVLTLFSDYSIPSITDDVNLSFRQKPYLISYHTEYISQSLGLRAPPVC